MESAEHRIKVKRSVIFEYEASFNENFYPGMSLAEACKQEKETSWDEFIKSGLYEFPETDSVIVTVVTNKEKNDPQDFDHD